MICRRRPARSLYARKQARHPAARLSGGSPDAHLVRRHGHTKPVQAASSAPWSHSDPATLRMKYIPKYLATVARLRRAQRTHAIANTGPNALGCEPSHSSETTLRHRPDGSGERSALGYDERSEKRPNRYEATLTQRRRNVELSLFQSERAARLFWSNQPSPLLLSLRAFMQVAAAAGACYSAYNIHNDRLRPLGAH